MYKKKLNMHGIPASTQVVDILIDIREPGSAQDVVVLNEAKQAPGPYTQQRSRRLHR